MLLTLETGQLGGETKARGMKLPRRCLTTVLMLAESIHLIEGSSMARAQPVTNSYGGTRVAPHG